MAIVLPVILAGLLLWLIYAALVRLAARLLGMRVAWMYALQFSAAVILTSLALRIVAIPLSLAFTDTMAVIAGLALHVAIGVWFLGPRVLTSDGIAAGWRGALKIVVAAFVVLLVFLVVLKIASNALLLRLHGA